MTEDAGWDPTYEAVGWERLGDDGAGGYRDVIAERNSGQDDCAGSYPAIVAYGDALSIE